MCEIFVKADPALYQLRAHSIRLHGAVTSLRLENLFWQVLDDIARRDGLSTNQLITRLYDEIVAERGRIDNFTSFLRVCCLRYQSLLAEGALAPALASDGPALEHLAQVGQERGIRAHRLAG